MITVSFLGSFLIEFVSHLLHKNQCGKMLCTHPYARSNVLIKQQTFIIREKFILFFSYIQVEARSKICVIAIYTNTQNKEISLCLCIYAFIDSSTLFTAAAIAFMHSSTIPTDI